MTPPVTEQPVTLAECVAAIEQLKHTWSPTHHRVLDAILDYLRYPALKLVRESGAKPNARYDNGWYYCWLIERRDRPQPEWLGDFNWTPIANDAIWYARKSDAEKVAAELNDTTTNKVVVCEHGFMLDRFPALEPVREYLHGKMYYQVDPEPQAVKCDEMDEAPPSATGDRTIDTDDDAIPF